MVYYILSLIVFTLLGVVAACLVGKRRLMKLLNQQTEFTNGLVWENKNLKEKLKDKTDSYEKLAIENNDLKYDNRKLITSSINVKNELAECHDYNAECLNQIKILNEALIKSENEINELLLK